MNTEYSPGSTITESKGEDSDRTEVRDKRFDKMKLDLKALVDEAYKIVEVVPTPEGEQLDQNEEPASETVVEEPASEEEEEDKKEEPMLCPKCKHPNPSYARVCIKCGTDVDKKAEPETAAPKFQEKIVTKPVSGVTAK